jgi:two-component system, response regulator PdtaR
LENEKNQTTQIKILLVEDEALTALAMNMILRSMGFVTCPVAATGQKALECMALEKPDVVLMDIHLTGSMNGIEAAARMQELGQKGIIFVTGYSSGDFLDRARAMKPAAILTKPVRPQALQHAIMAAVNSPKT